MTLTSIRSDAVSSAAASGRRGPVLTVGLWALQAMMAISFVAAGSQKLAGTHYMVVMFAKIGAGQWLRYIVGLVELAGAVGVLIPLLSGMAALGLAALMVGATITNLFIGYSPWVPVCFGVVSVLIAWGRWPHTKALAMALRR